MALGYKLITRKVGDLKGGEKVNKKFASPVYNGYTEIEDLCKAISERSALSSADVKAVLDSLNYVLDLELRGGRIVRLGELGNFRMTFSSRGIDPAEKFNVSTDIVGARIIFTPGKSLKSSRDNASFALAKEITHVDGDETTEEEDGGTPGGV